MLNIFLKLRDYGRSLRFLGSTHNLARKNSEKLDRIAGQLATKSSPQIAAAIRRGKKIKVLQTENFHLNSRNFSSLLRTLQSPNFNTFLAIDKKTKYGNIMLACGNYEEHLPLFAEYMEELSALSPGEIYTYRYKNVPVFDTAYHEALSACIAGQHWQSKGIEKSKNAIFNHFQENEDDWKILINCCAASMFWTDFWLAHRQHRSENIYTYDAAIIFSGAYIYGSVLIELLKFRKARSFVCESFITGDDFFLEESYHPIPNGSRIGFRTVFRSYTEVNPVELLTHDKNVAAAQQKLHGMQNKNVTQPSPEPLPAKLKGKDIHLIIGQVVNDFSLISGQGSILSSIPTYRCLIDRLLEDEAANIVFKGHPWERSKTNIGSDFTMNNLKEYVESLPASKRERVWIISDWNIKQLFRVSKTIITICSQAAIEAAAEGLKPITIGGTYYDSGRFTNAFETAEAAADAILSGELDNKLTFEEYGFFEEFIAVLLQRHLVNTGTEGDDLVREKLSMYLGGMTRQKKAAAETTLGPLWET